VKLLYCYPWFRPVLLAGVLAAPPGLLGQVVINEIHFDPFLKTEPVEFIELFNAGSSSVDLGGWSLSRAVEFVFASGTTVPAGGFVVVAENPGAVQAKFGATALGPWLGSLENDGETIELCDAQGGSIDEVDYRLGFPWPTVGDDPGYSIELTHPTLDNSVGGHWRVSSLGGGGGPPGSVLISQGSTWKFFKGTAEPSTPTTQWREAGFNDSGWLEGPMAIGYGDGHVVTSLADMKGSYSTVYFRRFFQVTDVTTVRELLLDVQYDDGVKVWINGILVLNANMPIGEVPNTGSAVDALEDLSFESFRLTNPGTYLMTGQNVIAVQGGNASLNGSSDFWVDLRLSASEGGTGEGPTPGTINAVYTSNVPPAIRQVDHSPNQPLPGETARIEAKVTDTDGIAAVTLHYQVVDPGAYIELEDPEYDTAWLTLPMRDDGTGGDQLAGDSVFTVELSGNLQIHRRLVRYRVEAADSGGREVLVPYPDDPVPNFAYFVYAGVPAWTGAVRPGDGGALGQVFGVSSNEMNRLPVIQLIAKKATVEEATWFSRYGGDAYQWLGTLVLDGKVYDHVRYRARGGVWRYAMCKNMWKFDSNRGHDFEVRDDYGRKYKTRWRKLNLGASIQQGDYDHRGEQGMFESVGFRLFNLAGVPAPVTTFAQLRIIDEPGERTPSEQYTGDFWGVYLVTEQLDGRFLDEHGLPDGNFYKMEGGSGELNNLGPEGPDNKSDLNSLLSSYGGATDAWWRANWELKSYYSYQAIVQGIHHFDISNGKNYFYYRNPLTSRWTLIPWDLDLTWAHNMYRSDSGGAGVDAVGERLLSPDRVNGTDQQSGTGVMRLSGDRPAIEVEFRNRLREVRDLLWNTDEGWRLIDEYAGRLRGSASGATLLDADRAQWDYNPKMVDSRYTTSPSGKAGYGRFYRWPRKPTVTKDFSGGVDLLKDYVVIRSDLLDSLATDGAIPQASQLSYVGSAGYPVNRITLRSSSFSGSGTFASMQVRVGEVTAPTGGSWMSDEPWVYEIDAVWTSGELGVFQQEVTVPPGLLKPDHVYRARVRMKDQTGRASHWSLPVEFVAGAPDNAVMLVDHLRVSELMVDPEGGGDFEFIEIQNTSSTVTLNLEGAKFTSGVDYVFPAGAALGPGARALVVSALDLAAFRAHYGLDAGVRLFGPYTGSLDNGGEELVLKTAPAGQEIVAFAFNDRRGWPVPAFGAGHSLVALDRSQSGQATGSLDYPGNWRASTYRGGSPGAEEPPVPAPSLVLNEIAAHTDYSDPLKPEYDSNDWVELVNRDASPVSFADFYLSDDPSDLKKWALPAGSLGPGERVSFDEINDFHNPITSGFGIDKAGEQVLLSYLHGTANDRVTDYAHFKGQENGRAYGRSPDATGEFGYLSSRSRDSVNTSSLGGLVIAELMYHPVDPDALTDNTWDEFVEIYNPTASTVSLEETNGTWRMDGGVSYAFPAGTQLAAGDVLVIVNFDPADSAARGGFDTAYGLTGGAVTLMGPYGGKLSNRSDRVGLEKPQAPDLLGEGFSWVVVDEVVYGNQDPWPAAANGLGQSLHRKLAEDHSRAPESWLADAPSPGEVEGVIPDGDSDSDGMPDSWEDAYAFLDRDDSQDADLDFDGDGLTNLEEYLAGTDPSSMGSALAVEQIEWRDGQVHLRVDLVAGRSYALETAVDPELGPWNWVQDVLVPPGGGLTEITDGPAGGEMTRYYRLVLSSNP